MYCFLDENDVVEDFPSFDESSLIFRDNPGQNSFKPGGYNLGYNLLTCIAQGDRPETVEGGGTFFFWDQSKEGRIGAASQLINHMRILDHL